MPTSTYDLIASNVLASPASSVTFSSIPSTYRDLVIVCQTIDAETNLRINGDTGSNYSYVLMQGNGSTAASGNATDNNLFVTQQGGMFIIQIFDYATTNKHKPLLIRTNDGRTSAVAARWASTSVVDSIRLYPPFSPNYGVGSTFYLYGIVS